MAVTQTPRTSESIRPLRLFRTHVWTHSKEPSRSRAPNAEAWLRMRRLQSRAASNVEEPAFQPGTWSGWGLRRGFRRQHARVGLRQFSRCLDRCRPAIPGGTQRFGFSHALTRVLTRSGAPGIGLQSVQDILRHIDPLGGVQVGAVYGLRGLLPARTWRAFGFIKPTGEQILFGFVGIVPAIFGGAAGQAVFNLFVGRRRDIGPLSSRRIMASCRTCWMFCRAASRRPWLRCRYSEDCSSLGSCNGWGRFQLRS